MVLDTLGLPAGAPPPEPPPLQPTAIEAIAADRLSQTKRQREAP
jgi:hypothetical protein